MSYYLRGLESVDYLNKMRCLFDTDDYLPIDADVVTRELRTTKNTLSIWQISDLSSNDEIEDAVCCISGSKSDLKLLNYILVPEDYLLSSGLVIEQTTPANIPLVDPLCPHYDIINLTMEKLISVMKMFSSVAKEDELVTNDAGKYIQFKPKPDIIKIIKQKDAEGRIRLAAMQEKVQRYIRG